MPHQSHQQQTADNTTKSAHPNQHKPIRMCSFCRFCCLSDAHQRAVASPSQLLCMLSCHLCARCGEQNIQRQRLWVWSQDITIRRNMDLGMLHATSYMFHKLTLHTTTATAVWRDSQPNMDSLICISRTILLKPSLLSYRKSGNTFLLLVHVK